MSSQLSSVRRHATLLPHSDMGFAWPPKERKRRRDNVTLWKVFKGPFHRLKFHWKRPKEAYFVPQKPSSYCKGESGESLIQEYVLSWKISSTTCDMMGERHAQGTQGSWLKLASRYPRHSHSPALIIFGRLKRAGEYREQGDRKQGDKEQGDGEQEWRSWVSSRLPHQSSLGSIPVGSYDVCWICCWFSSLLEGAQKSTVKILIRFG